MPSSEQPCASCRWAYEEEMAREICDHSAVEVRLAMALARWSANDPEVAEQELIERSAGFLDRADVDDVAAVLMFVEHGEATVFTVESRPEFDTEGGQGFEVNGVGFAVEYTPEGPGVVQPAATWRPPCDICGEAVRDFGVALCATCEDEVR